jgi:leucyl/phenylalanyl-tRNA--protein transferase
MRRTLRHGDFTLTHNRAFGAVMKACGEREEGTWILPEMLDAYFELHRLGHAHSFEVWRDAELVGGIYGISRGALFAAESMFHRVSNASKIALIACVRSLFAHGVTLFDVQLLTEHLASMGAKEIPRRLYLERVARAAHDRLDLSGLELVVE